MNQQWVVTTVERPGPALRQRAALVAERCGVRRVERRGPLRDVIPPGGFAYVVGRDRERLEDGKQSLFVHPGMLAARLLTGREQPLIRAILGGRERVRTVVDGTLGLAADALHLAAALDAEVLGVEVSPAVFSLCEEGLARLAREGLTAAARVRPQLGLARDVLTTLASGSADAVYLSPMFERPAAAAPGWDLLRPLAHADPVDAETVEEALRVGGRVVVKLAPRDPVPPALSHATWVDGRAVRYAIVTRA